MYSRAGRPRAHVARRLWIADLVLNRHRMRSLYWLLSTAAALSAERGNRVSVTSMPEARVCTSPACRSVGAREALDRLRSVSPPGLSVVEVGCRNLCSRGPVAALAPGRTRAADEQYAGGKGLRTESVGDAAEQDAFVAVCLAEHDAGVVPELARAYALVEEAAAAPAAAERARLDAEALAGGEAPALAHEAARAAARDADADEAARGRAPNARQGSRWVESYYGAELRLEGSLVYTATLTGSYDHGRGRLEGLRVPDPPRPAACSRASGSTRARDRPVRAAPRRRGRALRWRGVRRRRGSLGEWTGTRRARAFRPTPFAVEGAPRAPRPRDRRDRYRRRRRRDAALRAWALARAARVGHRCRRRGRRARRRRRAARAEALLELEPPGAPSVPAENQNARRLQGFRLSKLRKEAGG